MAASAEKIKELLGNGLSNEVVATAVGVHPSYISQLMSDEQFSADVIARRTATLTSATIRDRGWNAVEDKLLSKLNDLVDQDMIYKPSDVIRALVSVNNAKRRGTTAQESMVANKNVVVLSLPTVVVNTYKKNISGEVVEVTTAEGKTQTLVTMPASSLMEQLADKHQGKVEYDQVRRYLPSGAETKITKG